MHDEDLADAIVDRVLERGRFLTLDGPSMRTRHLGIDDPTSEGSHTVANQPARISGIDAPEFPEPTLGYTFGPMHSPRTGGRYNGAQPSKKAVASIKDGIRRRLQPGNQAPWGRSCVL